ncbi:hypothetical protein [Rubellicoccus peritrichatus]|uniref:Uncharacterized protein n=1 Tax=Rubellicoccus peritrichatus TaxID=3080537 RepID=A0AAQ3L9T5_9BACT|nr:hypothetical protein [Puniceicoccus sp. CR14]WOO40312.1 hypothetical protein RZN69_16965 [Puniceicoccus sp. CR14]
MFSAIIVRGIFAIKVLGVTALSSHVHSLLEGQVLTEYTEISDLDNKLQQTWTREQYIDVYKHQLVLNRIDEDINKVIIRKEGLNRFKWVWLETAAALYEETGDAIYLDRVKTALLHEVQFPSTDIQFTLSRITFCYLKARDDIELADSERSDVEAMLAAHADACLSMESGTEMNRGIMNTLGLYRTSKLLPDHSNSASWRSKALENWNQGLMRTKDSNEDSTSYVELWLYNMMMAAYEIEPDPQDFFQQSWVKNIFERKLGLLNSFGMDFRISSSDQIQNPAIYEWAATIYRDGRYKWAAQRIFNFLRAQEAQANHVYREPVFLYTSDDIIPVQPNGNSYYSDRRYDQLFPDKLALRSGFGPAATFLSVNLFNGGGHGMADGSSVITLVDEYGLLLNPPARGEAYEQYQNILLFRKDGDPFPLGSIDNGTLRRTVVDLKGGNTATGGKDINLQSVTGMGLRFDANNPSAQNTLIQNVYLVSGTERTKISTTPQSYPVSNKWMNYQNSLGYPLDVSGHDYLEFEWSYDPIADPKNPTVWINSSSPVTTTRFYEFLLNNWRSSTVRYSKDFDDIHIASIEVDLFGYDGADHKQYRDIFILPNELIWIRDSFEYKGSDSGTFQIGPLWHVGDITGATNEWANTRSYSNLYSRSDLDRQYRLHAYGPRRDLLVLMPIRPGYPDQENSSNPETASYRNEIVFQKWSGTLHPGQRISFNSFLLPHEADLDTAELSTLADAVDLLSDNDEVAVVEYGDWTLIANPYGQTVDLPGGLRSKSNSIAYRLNDEEGVEVCYEADEPD